MWIVKFTSITGAKQSGLVVETDAAKNLFKVREPNGDVVTVARFKFEDGEFSFFELPAT